MTSTLRRTHETAAAIIPAGLPRQQWIPGPEAVAIADLAASNFGAWQGLTHDERRQSPAGDFHHFRRAPAYEAAPAARASPPSSSECRARSMVWSRRVPGAT